MPELRSGLEAALVGAASPSCTERVRAGRDLASFADVPEAAQALAGLLLDAQDMAVTRQTAKYEDVPPEADFAPGSGQAFEEKLALSMTGSLALCEAHLSREESEILYGWTVLVPFSLDEEIWLPIESDDHESMVVGAPQVLPLAEKLAAAIDLPAETPVTCDNLDLSSWFRHQAKDLATARTGPWTQDLDAAFYVALFLRAAQHSIRRGCPIVCT